MIPTPPGRPEDPPGPGVEDDGSQGRLLAALEALQGPRVRLGILAVVLLGGFAAVAAVGGPTRAGVEQFVADAGPAGPLAFVGLYAVLTVLLVPGVVLTIAGGAVFGPVAGTALAVTGATAGAAGAFVVARGLGRDGVRELTGERLEQVDDWLHERGFLAVLYLRLIPIVPFNLLNYVAGVTGISRRDYVVATALGIIPGGFAYAALGSSLLAGDLTSPLFLTAVGLLAVLALGGPLVNRVLRRRGAEVPAAAAGDEQAADGPGGSAREGKL